jgi:hypothetical protein
VIESLVPSFIIGASTVAAFVLGRVLTALAARVTPLRVVRMAVLLIACVAAAFFYFSPSSRYALLLPAGFAAGSLTYARRRFVPGVFE